ncbi:LysM peptidoglycan-binding domain-containing protein [Weissella kandleri]|uniref:LysM peptidoglycan-binding domain-containing protein n=1 Tax=Weissella kandleri TaxID=1616 RepID=UPI00387E26A6
MTNAGKTGLSKNGKFLVTAAAALSAGFLAPMNHVKTGTANADTDVKANQNVYTVKAGDTLTKIARETGVDLETLAQQVQDENVIMVNQKLTLVQKEATVVDGTKIADLKYNANADANGDKFMSVSEYNNWVNNGRPEAATPASNAATTEASSTNNNVAVDGTNIADLQYNANADANGDGFMSADEYNNWVNNGRPEVAVPASNAATTEATATNNNVVVDGTNVADLQYNANADTDGDGFMSVDVFNNWVNNGRPEAAAPTSDAATTEATATNNNVAVDGTNIADLQYNANADTDGDGFMSVDEYNNWVNNGRPEAAAPTSDAATTEATATNNNEAVDGTNIADLQ